MRSMTTTELTGAEHARVIVEAKRLQVLQPAKSLTEEDREAFNITTLLENNFATIAGSERVDWIKSHSFA